MLLGLWKNIEELEASITLEELQQILDASREQQYRKNKFMAGLKGINLDEASNPQDKFDEISRRAEAKLSGKSEEELEFASFGIDFETS